ncbi:TonB-dependent siderophore receptor [bacterium]|nr:TonB-dependent siderophore receptor [bacterium]
MRTVRIAVAVRLGVMLAVSGGLMNGWALPTKAQISASAESSSPTEAANPTAQVQTPVVLSEVERSANTVSDWMAQMEAARVQITNVRVERSDTGLQLILETANGTLQEPQTRVIGNALIVEIANAAIAQEFSQADPIEGIALVEVTGLPGDRVRVAITGMDAPPVAQISSDTQQLTLSVAVGAAADAGDDDAIQVVVTGEQDEGYSPSTSSVTRFDAPLLDTPLSIQVIPQQVFRDQGANSLTEALQSASSVVASFNSPRDIFNALTIRGFRAFNNSLRNGITQNDIFALPTDLANIERLEIIGGPASILSGQVQPGGVINFVTEQPLRSPFYEVRGSYGSFNTFRGAFDISGPLNADQSLLYRLNSSISGSDTFIEAIDPRRQFLIAPVISWQVDEDTLFTLETQYVDADSPNDVGLPREGTLVDNPNGELPRDRHLGDPEFDRAERRVFQSGYNLEHEISEDWSLRHTFDFSWAEGYQNQVSLEGLLADGRMIERSYLGDNLIYQNVYRTTASITGNFETGSIEHQLVFGVDYAYSHYRTAGTFGTFESIDIFDPEYGRSPTSADSFDFTTNYDDYGVFLQDRITISDNLILLVGGRLDFSNIYETDNRASATNEYSANAFNPQLGIVYKPAENISLYGSFSRSFETTFGLSRTGESFLPTRGTQFEIGAKVDFDDSLFATLALYDLTLTNVLTPDPDNSGFSIQTGEQSSQGVETRISGEILPGWNIIAGYSYTDARVTEDNSIPEGDRLANAPEHAFSIWSTYTIPSGSLQGLGFGLGLFYVGERAATLPNTFDLPGYLRTDAALFYRRNQFRAALNIKNLFNIDYFPSATFSGAVNPGDSLTVELSLEYQF